MSRNLPEISQFSFNIKTKEGNPIEAEIFYLNNPTNSLPVLIIVHGFTGFKNWGFLPFLAKKLAHNNFAVITFNFSHDGISKNRDWVDYPELFENNTISLEIHDLDILITSIRNGLVLPESIQSLLDLDKFLLIGQSLGGAISLIYTAKFGNIDKLVMLGSIGTLFRYTKRQMNEWKKRGFLEFNNSRTGQTLRISYKYIEDLYANDYRLEKYLSQIKIPVLYLHGSEDYTVPLSEIKELIIKSENPLIILKVIENTGHTFGIEHPFSHPTKALREVIKNIINFLSYE